MSEVMTVAGIMKIRIIPKCFLPKEERPGIRRY